MSTPAALLSATRHWGGLLAAGLVTLSVALLPAVSANATVSAPALSTPPGSLLATLAAPGATPDQSFGRSVAVSGTTAIVGADGADSSTGAAYIYVKGASGWPTTPTTTLADPAATALDSFGYSVAISGKNAIVGAFDSSNTGVAYIYVKGASGWPTTPTTTLADPAATAGDSFGFSVALSGKIAVVGAFESSLEGAAYIYVKGASGWPTTPTTTLADPAATADDQFGFSVAISGKTAVVGAVNSSGAGASYVYVKGTSGWPTTPTTTLADPEATSGDEFGYAVAASGKTAIISAANSPGTGAAYVYVKSTSGWPSKPTTTLADPEPTAGDQFGYSVAASGKTAFVGAVNYSAAGATYIYVKGTSGWPATPTTTLADPGANVFGRSVAVSGKTAIVGAIGAVDTGSSAGTAYIYEA